MEQLDEPGDPLAPLNSPALLEDVASQAHTAWSGWMEYLFRLSVSADGLPGLDGALVIPAGLVTRWKRQMTTPYALLSEGEKNSDRDEARRYLEIVAKHLKEK